VGDLETLQKEAVIRATVRAQISSKRVNKIDPRRKKDDFWRGKGVTVKGVGRRIW